MADRTCTIDDCERPTGVPGTARGLCGLHYQRAQRYGDRLIEPPSRKRYCDIEGCDADVVGHGLCSKHYTRWKRHGDPAAVGNRVDRENGKRRCSTCREEKVPTEFHRNRSRVDGLQVDCKACACARKSARDASRAELLREERRRAYEADPEAARERSRDWRKRNADAVRAQTALRRARRSSAPTVELVSRDLVLERDAWTCGICKTLIDPSSAYPDPMSPSIDHVIPLARGGSHTYDNVQATHLRCNLRKHASVKVVI